MKRRRSSSLTRATPAIPTSPLTRWRSTAPRPTRRNGRDISSARGARRASSRATAGRAGISTFSTIPRATAASSPAGVAGGSSLKRRSQRASARRPCRAGRRWRDALSPAPPLPGRKEDPVRPSRSPSRGGRGAHPAGCPAMHFWRGWRPLWPCADTFCPLRGLGGERRLPGPSRLPGLPAGSHPAGAGHGAHGMPGVPEVPRGVAPAGGRDVGAGMKVYVLLGRTAIAIRGWRCTPRRRRPSPRRGARRERRPWTPRTSRSAR